MGFAMQNSGYVATFRKLTPGIVASQRLAMANDIVETTKSEVSLALKKVAPVLGIDGTTYQVMDILIGLTSSDDWRPDRKPLVAISNEKLAEYVCRSKRTVSRCIKKLSEAGVLAYRDSPTGRRFIRRDASEGGKYGEIQVGYGFDFSPARQRVNELKDLAKGFAEKLKVEKEAKRTISRLRRHLEDLAVLAVQEEVCFERVQDARAKLENCNLSMAEKAEALEMLYQEAVALFDKNEMSSEGDISVTPYNHTNIHNLDSSNRKRRLALANHSNVHDPEQVGVEMAYDKTKNGKISATKAPCPEGLALENISIGLMSKALIQLKEALGFEVRSWVDLFELSGDISLLIGLSKVGWMQAENKVGRYTAVAVLAATAEKALRDPLAISSPGGYFRACIDRAIEGKLALHRTLFGLASKES
ncbi:hypothetical protein PsAD46_02640 [Pseudovibrio sp. Ad46]|uniref:plasmid replication protein RepC n=1 Tax=Pseudovibrio sp. Ad46 TaxID=989432 RepID=UPI0007B1B411|nr:plasmid replication protein RepC [Pseudovibrio sp. Ad46]KZK88045.1 hypothetical protein PsAD46_02640 [Pseudovibrio sp. Ad46]